MGNWKREVIDAGIRMLSEGITIGTWGNVTVRDPETGYVYLSPSGMPYRSLTEDDIVVVRLDGSRVEGERKPTIETEMHLAIYRARPECNAVIHTHPVYSTAFSCMGEDIPLLLDEAAQVLAEECVKALGERSMACLLKSHGAVCLGRDLEQAFGNSTVLEATAKVYSVIRAMGGQFDPISPENIAFMQEFVRTKYGQR